LKKKPQTGKSAQPDGRKTRESAKRRNKAAADQAPVIDHRPEGQQAKGRATPSRKQVEQARVRPLVGASSKTSNLTKEQRREASRLARERYNEGMRTGDERYLPARDKGPIKRFVRDWVDAGRSISEYFLWVALGLLLTMAVLQQAYPGLALIIMLAIYVMVFATIGDLYFRSRKLRKALAAKFGEGSIPKGTVRYGVMRSMQFRRGRMPKPQVPRGQYPK